MSGNKPEAKHEVKPKTKVNPEINPEVKPEPEVKPKAIPEVKPDFNRVVKALRHEEPDRVPMMEAAISYEIMSKFIGKEIDSSNLEAQVEFWVKAGYDYVALTAGMMQPGKVTKDSYISRVIQDRLVEDVSNGQGDESWNLEKRSFINDESDFDAFPWEEAGKLDLSKFYEVQKYLPENMKVIALSGKIFTLSWLLMGYENFCVNLLINYDFVKRVVDKVASIQYEALKNVIGIPYVGAFWAIDDIAFGTGTIIKPDFYRELIFPWYKKFAEMCHANGKFLFYHSDGVLWEVIEDLIEIGIDGLHPIDPTCMDIEEVKRKVGGRISIFGNIPNDLLMEGEPGEVMELTKKRIKALAPGGGYCVASGNSIPEWANIENYRAMIEATLKYGIYPINIK